MDPKKLEEMIVKHKSEGRKPFFVNCTSGTTVMGAFDPINAIADICQEHNVWMHIDVSNDDKLLKFSVFCYFNWFIVKNW